MRPDRTLEQYMDDEANHHLLRIANAKHNVDKMKKRVKDAKKRGESPAEIARLEALVILHTNYHASLGNVDVAAAAQEKFARQEERKTRHARPIE